MKGLIWWIWNPWPYMGGDHIHGFDVKLAWELGLPPDNLEPDVYWLGECAWTCMEDNTNLGLRTV